MKQSNRTNIDIFNRYLCMNSHIKSLNQHKRLARACMDFQNYYIFQLNRPPMFAILRANKRGSCQKSDKNVGKVQTEALNLLAEGPGLKRKAPAFVSRLLLAAFCFKNGLFWRSRRDSNARRSAQETKTGLSSYTPRMPANACYYCISNKFDCPRFLQKTPLLPQCDQTAIRQANRRRQDIFPQRPPKLAR